MYSKKDIEKTLVEFNYFIDDVTLANFIKNWKIDPIYEDEDGIEFYDNLAIAKLKKGISLKSQGYTNDQIIYHINKLLPEKLEEEKLQKEKEVQERMKKELPSMQALMPSTNNQTTSSLNVSNISSAVGSELKNVTIDVTHQTLQMLADTIVEKITNQISEKINLPESTLIEDNKELSKKIEELTEDNVALAKKVEELEQHKAKHLFNIEYIAKFFK